MRGKVSKARRVVSLVLAAVLVLPMMSVSTAFAADTPFSGGPMVGNVLTLLFRTTLRRSRCAFRAAAST